jgi:hypothetical protein
MTSWILYRKWHSNVPLQDFRPISETSKHPEELYRNLGERIDWSKSIPEIDQQLYKKYKLSDEEINFIETRVKDMV